MSWHSGQDSGEKPTRHSGSLETGKKEGKKSKLFTRPVLPALTKDLFHTGKRKL